MLVGIDASANAVRKQTAKAASHVELQSKTFYEKWFVQFYEGRQPAIDSLWPFLSLVMQRLPLGLKHVNPLRMTIADWTEAIKDPPSPPSPARILGLERLGFRRRAEAEAKTAFSDPKDTLRCAIENSIRKRGYEQASIILLPLTDTLTRGWLPSEKIGCRIASSALDFLRQSPSELAHVKYVLREVAAQKDVDQIIQDLAKLTAVPKLAFFGSGSLTMSMPRGYTYIPDPQSLDHLVEILDARPSSDWADIKKT
jgi:hypothetical protein